MTFGMKSRRGLARLAGLAVAVATVGVARADAPTGWFAAGSDPNNYEFRTDAAEKHGGKASGSLQSKDTAGQGFGTMMQMFRADDHRGKRVRMSGWAKAKDVEGSAGLWLRVDGTNKSPLAFDNMQERAIKGTSDWTKYDIVLDVPDDSAVIAFGVLLAGKGQVWVDDFKFETVEKDVPVTGVKVEPGDTQAQPADRFPKQPANLDFEKE